MGYERKYRLSFPSDTRKCIGEQKWARLMCEIVNGFWSVNHLIVYGIEAKWYDHETDLRALSVAWPDVIFTLCGVAADFDGVPTETNYFVKYFVAGKMQHEIAQVTFAPLDTTKLQ